MFCGCVGATRFPRTATPSPFYVVGRFAGSLASPRGVGSPHASDGKDSNNDDLVTVSTADDSDQRRRRLKGGVGFVGVGNVKSSAVIAASGFLVENPLTRPRRVKTLAATAAAAVATSRPAAPVPAVAAAASGESLARSHPQAAAHALGAPSESDVSLRLSTEEDAASGASSVRTGSDQL